MLQLAKLSAALSLSPLRNTPGRRSLTPRQKLQNILEPNVPTFNSIIDECEWRIEWLNLSFSKPINEGTIAERRDFQAHLGKWIQVASLLGYYLADNHQVGRGHQMISICKQFYSYWEEYLDEWAIKLFTYQKPVEAPNKQYIVVNNSGISYSTEAPSLFELVKRLLELPGMVSPEEYKKMERTFLSLDVGYISRLNIKIEKQQDLIVLSLKQKELKEFIIKEVEPES